MCSRSKLLRAFAAIRGDGSVVTWGCGYGGGDSSAVQEQLRDVQQIQACVFAFAAILGDGSVVTWGHADCCRLADGSVVTWGGAEWGGDSSAVQDQLRNVSRFS